MKTENKKGVGIETLKDLTIGEIRKLTEELKQ